MSGPVFKTHSIGQAYVRALLLEHRRAIERLTNCKMIAAEPEEIPPDSVKIRIPFKYLKPGG